MTRVLLSCRASTGFNITVLEAIGVRVLNVEPTECQVNTVVYAEQGPV